MTDKERNMSTSKSRASANGSTTSNGNSTKLAARFHPIIVCPLANLGNTCYFNAGMQMLCSCAPFVLGLRDSPFSPARKATVRIAGLGPSSSSTANLTAALCRGGKYSRQLLVVFSELLWAMETAEVQQGEGLQPYAALNQLAEVYPAFEGRNQQDVAEMLNVVIANLAEEGRIEADLSVLLKSFCTATTDWENRQRGQLGDRAIRSVGSPEGREREAAKVRDERPQLEDHRRESGSEDRSPRSDTQVCASGTGRVDDDASSTLSRSVADFQGDFMSSAVVDEVTYCIPSLGNSESTTAPMLGHSNGSMQQQSLVSLFSASRHQLAALQMMQKVNEDNEAMERKEKQRKKEPYHSSFRPPLLFFNNITDAFKGHYMSEITCHSCTATSRIVEEFNSLMIDIPSARQRSHFAQQHPDIVRRSPDGTPLQAKPQSYGWRWWNPLSALYYMFGWAYQALSALTGSSACPLTLEECLDIHFNPVNLHSGNRYHCASCGILSEATKSECLLDAPEYLLIQMKRFDYGLCFHTKKNDAVIFPMSWDPLPADAAPESVRGAQHYRSVRHPEDVREILDLSAYVHQSVFSRRPRGEDSSGGVMGGVSMGPADHSSVSPMAPPARPLAQSDHSDPVLTYTLEAVVHHNGSFSGGHYTASSRKKSASDVWVEFNDDVYSSVEPGKVADAEEYLLLYRKQPLHEMPRWHSELQLTAREYLTPSARARSAVEKADAAAAAYHAAQLTTESASRAKSANGGADGHSVWDSDVVFLSRLWLQRMAVFVEPGPVLNQLCYCTEAKQQLPVKDANVRSKQATPTSSPPQHIHGPACGWAFVPVLTSDYCAFFSRYGGNAPMSVADYVKYSHAQQDYVRAVHGDPDSIDPQQRSHSPAATFSRFA